MKAFKKLIGLMTVMGMLGFSMHSLEAQEYSTDVGGYGYTESRTSPALAPAIALGTIALIAIIAVAVQNSSHSSHGHAH